MRQVYEENPETAKEPRPLLADAQVGDLCQTRGEGYHLISDVYTDQRKYAYERNCGDTIYVRENGMFNLINHEHPFDIIHTEPLAPEGTAEWAWQMLMLQKPVYHPAEGEFQDTYYTKEGFVRCMAKTGWQLYAEPEPEPKFAVGDWVEFRDIEGIKHGIIEGRREEYSVFCNGVSQSVGDKFITSKLKPSEVVLNFGSGIKGTVRSCEHDGGCVRVISGDRVIAHIMTDVLEQPTCNLVRQLLKAQEEK